MDLDLEKLLHLKKLNRFLAKNAFNEDARLKLYHNILNGLKENISHIDIIIDLHARYKATEDSAQFMTEEWIDGFENGKEFSEVAKDWIPSSEIFLIVAGEKSENLSKSLEELIRVSGEKKKLKALAKKTVVPQLISLTMLFAIIYFFSSFMAPSFKEMVPEEDWSPLSVNYFNFSDWMVNNMIFVVGIVLAVIITVGWSFKNFTNPSIRPIIDKYPPWTIYREIESANLLISLAGMLESNVSLNHGLKHVKDHASKYTKGHLVKIIRQFERGSDDGSAMDTGLLPTDVSYEVKDYGKRAGFARGIVSIGGRISKEVIVKVEKQSSLFAGITKFSIFGYAGFTIMAIMDVLNAAMAVL